MLRFFISIVVSIVLLCSCKSNEDKAKDAVDRFMNQINKEKQHKKDVDFSYASDDYKQLFLDSPYYTAQE